MIHKCTRNGQTLRFPLLCDPEFPADVTPEARDLFAKTLDVKVLGVDLSRVTHATIRSINGPTMADAQMAGSHIKDPVRGGFAAAEAIVRAGLVSVDGLDDVTQAGGLYLALVMELAQRIQTWSTLGESVGSSSVP